MVGRTAFSEMSKIHVAFSVVNLHFLLFSVSRCSCIFHYSLPLILLRLLPLANNLQSIGTAYRLPDFHYHPSPYFPLLQKACCFTNCSSSEIMCLSEMEALLPLLVPRKWPKHLQMLMGF